jgi:hypothetical protein
MNGYGLWALVAFNSLLFIAFAASFFHPQSKRDWRALGGFSAFVVALFNGDVRLPVERVPVVGPGGEPVAQLGPSLERLDRLEGRCACEPVSPRELRVHRWRLLVDRRRLEHLYEAQKAHRLATTGPYAYVRHPQYAGFVLIMVGFLLQWPTFATLLMFPLLLIVYRKLAMREEREVAAEFGAEWEAYAADRPRFLPRLRELGHRPTARQDAKPVTEAKPALVRARVASDDTRRRRS